MIQKKITMFIIRLDHDLISAKTQKHPTFSTQKSIKWPFPIMATIGEDLAEDHQISLSISPRTPLEILPKQDFHICTQNKKPRYKISVGFSAMSRSIYEASSDLHGICRQTESEPFFFQTRFSRSLLYFSGSLYVYRSDVTKTHKKRGLACWCV